MGGRAAAETPAGPFTVDLSNREEVRRFFFSTYRASEDIPVGWTGDVARCDPGTVSNDFLEATRTRINYFRAMAGVPSDVVFTAENNAKAQATALLMSAQRALSHEPPATWKCWTPQGAEGARKSNLQFGSTGPAAIDDLMVDDGNLGHRRTILNPQNIEMGSGSIPPNPDGNTFEAQYMAENPNPALRPVRDGFVAWPPKGFVPYQNTFPLWHFSLRDADFANATVSMTRNGAPLATTITNRESFAGPGIVWNTAVVAEGGTWPTPTRDDTYRVTVGNVLVAGAAQTFSYDVTVFDPAFGDPARAVLQIAGPDAPPVGATSTYTATAVPNTSGYQWRTTRLTPIAAAEGAEAGLGNFVATVGGYNPVATNPVATGTASLRLTIRTDANPTNTATLTDRRVLVPTATSELRFKSRAISTANVADLVQVSTDAGATWSTVFTDPSTDDAAFVDRTVSLAAFAGRHLSVRFRSQPAFTGGWAGGDQFGWYVDDVTLTDTFAAEVAEPVVTPTPVFTVTPTDSALIDIEVRPRFVASGFGEWAPARRVSPVGPPLITATPSSITVVAGGAAAFSVAATGPGPLGFVWALNGVDLVDAPTISGSRTATLRLANVQPAQAGRYSARVANGLGATTSAAATLTVTPAPPTLDAALDTTGLAWTSGGDRSWLAQTAVSHDGVDAARSGPIGDSQSSRLSTTVTGPATVGFWWKVSSEATFDFLNVEVDGVRPFDGISGEVDWRQQTLTVAAGPHTLAFVYSKDNSQAAGLDSGFVDGVTVTAPTPAAPATPPAPLPPAPAPATGPLAAAMDAPTIAVQSTGTTAWTAQTAVSHDGIGAARSGPVGDNGAGQLSATVNGPATISFWWKVDSEANFDFLNLDVDGGQPFGGISGDVDWQQRSVTVGTGAHLLRWIYSKDRSGTGGQDAAWLDQLVVGPAAGPALPAVALSLATAVNAPALVLSSAGNAGWTAATAVAHDGAASARTGAIADNQSTRLETTITGGATLRFWWKVDSESGFDFLQFELDGVRVVTGISGSVDWQQQTVAIPAGTHSVRWVYRKDESQSVGQDAGWVDQITLT